MTNTFFLTVFCLIISTSTFAQSGSAPTVQPDKTVVQGVMDRIFLNYAALTKLAISEENFIDPKNEKEIKDRIQDLNESIQLAMKQHQLKSELMRISGRVLLTQFKDAQTAFNTGHKSYSRWMLNSSLSICMSCHIQVRKTNQSFEELLKEATFADQFDQAELRFTLRNYDKSLPVYEKLILEYPKNQLPLAKLEVAMKRKLAIYARIKRNPKMAIDSLTKDLNQKKKYPPYLVKNMEAWVALFRRMDKENKFDAKTATDDQILKFAESKIKNNTWDKMQDAENPKMVTYLWVSGVLYDYFQLHPKTKIAPELLYFLAICDRGLNNNFFYSLAELYLKECIIQYPKSPIAKKCFKEYEDTTISSFSGSAGTNVPDDVQKELKQYSEMVN